ncbi:MAG: hypothetical protein J0H25_09605, partial [Rhizobiales bacterium]|nr:hypothetical protein [Hyphomicrobiales bacterium]
MRTRATSVMRSLLVVATLVVCMATAHAEDAASKPAAQTDTREAICLMIESAAKNAGLPLDF